MADDTVSILGLSGSLRQGSLNTALIEAAAELAPDGIRVERFALSPIPLYNEDVRLAGLPDAVDDLRNALADADAVLIATPEYNYSIPRVLKNAIDWASRPPDQPFSGKPVAIIGASPGGLGTGRAQYHLRQCFVFLDAHLLNKPEVLVRDARALIDDDGRVHDEETRNRIRGLVEALADWTRRLRSTARDRQ